MNEQDEAYVARASEVIAWMPTMKNAAGCMDCDQVFKIADRCPVCGSGSVLNIASILNGVARKVRWLRLWPRRSTGTPGRRDTAR